MIALLIRLLLVQFLIPGADNINQAGTVQYQIPGGDYLDDTGAPSGTQPLPLTGFGEG